LENLPLPIRPINKPLRVNITNFYESQGGKIKGHCISGKIEGGILQKDEKYVILPQDCQCIVKDILIGNDKVKEAVVGDNV
jgi:elongation factor 1 alpha-like protein